GVPTDDGSGLAPFTPPQPNWPAHEVPNAPTGRIYVATSDVATNALPTAIPGVYRFDSSTTQVQTLTLPTLTAPGTFTLTFTNWHGDTGTTGQLSVNSPNLAQDIENALNARSFASIGGWDDIGDMNDGLGNPIFPRGNGHVVVKQSLVNPLVFDIAIE